MLFITLPLTTKNRKHLFFSAKKLIYFSQSVKLLGVHLDSKPTWNEHVTFLCKQLSRVTFLLKNLKMCLHLDELVIAYFGMFHHLMYGIRLWGNVSAPKKGFIWHKKTLRAMLGLSNFASLREKKSLSWKSRPFFPVCSISCTMLGKH